MNILFDTMEREQAEDRVSCVYEFISLTIYPHWTSDKNCENFP